MPPPTIMYVLAITLVWLGTGLAPADSPGREHTVATPDSILYVELSPWQGGDCEPDAMPTRPCRVRHPWTEAGLRARWAEEGRPAWTDGDTLTFVYEREAPAVDACCTIQMPMSRLAGSALWVLSMRIPNLAVATIEYGFLPEGERRLEAMGSLRGPAAPPPPIRARTLQGTVRIDSLQSLALGERRALTVYEPPAHVPRLAGGLPTVYVADGQSVGGLASYLEPFILAGEVPPVLLVGLHSGPHRSDEYTSIAERSREADLDNPRFVAHERFVLDEVLPWAERTLGASPERERRAAFGFSNGGVWAAFQGARHPEAFGAVLSFSCGACSVAVPEAPAPASAGPAARFYFLAGHLEPRFLQATRQAADRLRRAGYESVMHERVAGHDSVMWNEQFGDAVRWAFGELRDE